MNPKYFLRVANTTTQQGLWYDFDGNYTGFIHTIFKFCKSSVLPMPPDIKTVGWLSATGTFEELLNWFPMEDIRRLENYGYQVLMYESSNYKHVGTHWLIDKNTAICRGKIILNYDKSIRARKTQKKT